MTVKFIYFVLIFFPSLSMVSQTSVMSYNIRYATDNDGDDAWSLRKDDVKELLIFYHPDIFGVQEATPEQVAFLNAALREYKMIGEGRDGDDNGEYSAVYYDASQYEVKKSGTFWLNASGKKAEKGWDAALPRICTYALVIEKVSARQFYVFNTHFDHIGVAARENSAILILQKIKEINAENLPLVVMGDLNSEPDTKPIEILKTEMDAASEISNIKPYGPAGTFNAFELDAPLKRTIDYIFTKGFKVKKYRHIDDKRDNGRWVSDHLPVMAIIE